MSSRQYVDRAYYIGVFLVAALDTGKSCLCLPVLCRHMPAARTCAARVVRWHGDEHSPRPLQLVFQLPSEFMPALVEDALVQPRLGPNIFTRLLDIAGRRLGHVPHLQILDAHHSVVLADGTRGLVQVVASGVADSGMNALDAGLGPFPIAAEFHFAAQDPLHGA